MCGSLWGLNKFKMVAVAMVTKVQKMLNSLPNFTNFAEMFPVTSTSSGTRYAQIITIGTTNYAAVAMETKKGGI